MCSSNTQDLSSIYSTYISNNLYDMRTLNYYPLLDRIIEWLDQEYGDNLISQEAVRLIEKMAEEHYREWKANASEDQVQAASEELLKFTSDPEYGAQSFAFLQETFFNADANGDGKLGEVEFSEFHAVLMQDQAEKGQFVDQRPEFAKD